MLSAFRKTIDSCLGRRDVEEDFDTAKPLHTSAVLKAAFLPQYVRELIRQGRLYHLPTLEEMPVVMLRIDVPEIREFGENYWESKVFTFHNVAQEINNILEPIVKFVLSQGGDLMELSGGIWHWIWPFSGPEDSAVLTHVINVAYHLQAHYTIAKTVLGFQLSFQCGIAVGNVVVMFVGNPEKIIRWCVTGTVVDAASLACSLCKCGKVVLSDGAWRCFNRVQSSTYFGRVLQQECVEVNKVADVVLTSENFLHEDIQHFMQYLQNNYLSILTACVPPLPAIVSTLQQLDVLSSLTQISIMGILVQDSIKMSLQELQVMSSAMFVLVDKYDAVITKIRNDKGVIFGILFGCAGFKHHDDATRSLHFSHEAVIVLRELGYSCLVRVATALSFQSFIGNRDRLDCCLFGKAITAAQNMIHYFTQYPIVCGINTVMCSRRDVGNIFTLIEKHTRTGRGIPVCYSVNFDQSEREWESPLIGRLAEKELLLTALKSMLKLHKTTTLSLPLIAVIGGYGSGKSQFLKWAAQQAYHSGYSVCCHFINISYEKNFENAWNILKNILVSTYMDSEKKISELFAADSKKFPLHLLNDYIGTKFPIELPRASQELKREMLVELIQRSSNDENVLILIDDVGKLSHNTWLFLQDVLITKVASIIISYDESMECSNLPFVKYMLRQHHCNIRLGPLEENETIVLICHYLHVVAINKVLARMLIDFSEKNPLKLHEILLLPQMQRHLCFVALRSMVRSTLEEYFYCADEFMHNPKVIQSVCDVLDPAGLKSIDIPKRLIEVVKTHTIGLTPEEDILTKKCACLGESFSIYLLESVSPEYSSSQLRLSVVHLIRKNLLAVGCDHLIVTDEGIEEIEEDQYDLQETFCTHSLTFRSSLLWECVINLMLPGQMEKLHLFIVMQLQNAKFICNSCLNKPGPLILVSYSFFKKDCVVPKVNFTRCRCIDFKLNTYFEINQHLTKGNADVLRRINFFVEASETALGVGKKNIAVNLLKQAQEMIDFDLNLPAQEFFPVQDFSFTLAKIAIKRIQAWSDLAMGNTTKAMDGIRQALIPLGRKFPDSYLKRNILSILKRCTIARQIEETKCLALGSSILLNLGYFHNAYALTTVVLGCFKRFLKSFALYSDYPSFCELLKVHMVRFVAASKTETSSQMHKHLYKLLEICNKRLDGNKSVDVIDLKAIVKCYANICLGLFENNELIKSLIVGSRIFVILSNVQGNRELMKTLTVMALIYYHQKSINKCFEMMNHLFDIAEQTGDLMAEALYFSLSVKTLRRLTNPEIRLDKVKMVNHFAKNHDPRMIPTKQKTLKYWITSLIALWCSEQNLNEAFTLWHHHAKQLKDECRLVDYWSLSAALTMIIITFNDIHMKSYNYNNQQIEEITEITNNEILDIEERALIFAPVISVKLTDTKLLIHTVYLENVGINY